MKNPVLFLAVVFFMVLLSAVSVLAIPVQRLTITDWDYAVNDPSNVIPTVYRQVNMDLIMGTYQGAATLDTNGYADKSSGILGGDLDQGGTYFPIWHLYYIDALWRSASRWSFSATQR